MSSGRHLRISDEMIALCNDVGKKIEKSFNLMIPKAKIKITKVQASRIIATNLQGKKQLKFKIKTKKKKGIILFDNENF